MEPFLGQIQAFGFNFTPRGWAQCNGQLLSIAQNTALFSLLGTTYGGDGRTTFGLPDLRGRSIVGMGQGPGFSEIRWGERGGVENVKLTGVNLPNHSHVLQNGVANVAVTNTPVAVKIQTINSDSLSSETDNGESILGTSGVMPEIYREKESSTDFLGGVSVSGGSATTTISGQTNSAGNSQPFQNRNPFLGINVCIALVGIFPSRS